MTTKTAHPTLKFRRIALTNWKNFLSVDVALPDRAFLIGPNASGKSNFLDAFRFLSDMAGKGIQQAVGERGGIQKLRCLQARNPSDIRITVTLDEQSNIWEYDVAFTQSGQFPRQGYVLVKQEVVKLNGDTLLERPDDFDKEDQRLLEQTALEQVSRNGKFRGLADHFKEIAYLHLVPQLIRTTRGISIEGDLADVYGGRFIEVIATKSERERKRYLGKIRAVLKIVVPQLKDIELTKDDRGIPHLEAMYEHWRPNAGRQNESQFSDGTLRLIGLLWALQDGDGLILMEEPELSLHQTIVRQLASFIHRAQHKTKSRQAFISTHSVDLLSDEGIAANEILLFDSSGKSTIVNVGAQLQQISDLMGAGLTAADIVLPMTAPEKVDQLRLFDL